MNQPIIFLALILPSLLFSTEPSTTVNISPSVIGTNEYASVEITVLNEELRDIPTAKPSSAYTLEYISSGIQHQASIVNGSINMKTYYTYNFRLKPLKPGTYTIPGFKIYTKNREFFTDSSQITIEEKAAVRAPVRQNIFNPFSSFPNNPGSPFLLWVLSRAPIIQNTLFVADLYFSSENPDYLEIFNAERDLKQEIRAIFDGGVLLEAAQPPAQRLSPEISEYEGVLIKRYIAYALSTNNVVLRPPTYLLNAGMYTTYVQGNSINIPVEPAANGLGYVGNKLTIKISLDNNSVNTGENAVLSLILEGDGNVDYFNDPFAERKIDNLFISQAKTEVEVDFQQPDDLNSVFMKKTFTYTISPRKEGLYVIPPLNLNYTSPAGIKKTASTEALNLQALSTDTTTDIENFSPLAVPKGYVNYSSGLGFLLAAWLLGISLMLWAWQKNVRNNRLQNDEDFARREGAKTKLHETLKIAENALFKNLNRDASRLLRQSLPSYCTDKFSLDPSLTPKEIASLLESKAGEEIKKTFLSLIDDLDYAAFGLEPSTEQVKALLAKAETLLTEIDTIKV